MKVGETIDQKYMLTRLIGRGGMGQVFEAEHMLVARRYAVKTLYPHLAKQRETVIRFLREARVAGTIGSDHIVEVFDAGFGDENNPPYLVMEYLEGCDLSQLLRQDGPLTERRAAMLMRQICEGVAAAHSAGIVHRDLKPENLWAVRSPFGHEWIKICDFGVAKFRDLTGLTSDRSLLGTPCFMAPELLAGAQYASEQTDIYALGVILYELLTVKLPFRSQDLIALADEILDQDPIPPEFYRPDLNPELAQVVLRAMARRSADRFQSADALAEALEPFSDIEF